MSKIQITLPMTDANNAMLVMVLYELLEQPHLVKQNLSNVAQPHNFEWLLDEVQSFQPIMRELDRENEGDVYADDHAETETSAQ